ncbi:MAG: DUF1015 domain-containing protein [Lachnospiraceae bacterium]|nr:DUF1015 domain-containing protein [Lachnospiraceae bacterium]
MADVRPFCAIRPRVDLAEQIAALPYDVFDRKEARRFVEERPGSFLAIDRPETAFEEGHDMYAPEVYAKAHDLLWERIGKGDFVREQAPAYYLYEQTWRGRTQTGIVACASVDDYVSGVIKKHENTRKDKEEDRVRHVDACDAQTGPIFLCFRRDEAIAQVVASCRETEPVYDFTSHDNTKNRIWIIDKPDDIDRIAGAFRAMDSIYIADGHHRCASAVRVGLARREQSGGGALESDHFLAVLFPEDELQILDYNRVVRDLNGLTEEAFLAALAEKFDVTPAGQPVAPEAKGVFGMYLGEQWYRLCAKDAVKQTDAVEGLDVSLLQREVLAPILGIGDPKTDKRIDFVGGVRGLQELERRCHTDMCVAFSMYPTSLAELFAVADEGRLMPPKSTWFEPKLLSGLFIHAFA